MAERQQRIGKDGQVKTVIKKTPSREKRIAQHMHGRSDHIRRTGDGKFVLVTVVVGLAIITLLWLCWRMMG